MTIQFHGIDLIAYDSLFRRNLLSHGTLPEAGYFLIATPDRLYFWKQDGRDGTEAPPDFTFDTEKEFRPYFEKVNLTPERIGGQALDFLVLWWLTDLARDGSARVKEEPSMRWLAESGFVDAWGKARIELNDS